MAVSLEFEALIGDALGDVRRLNREIERTGELMRNVGRIGQQTARQVDTLTAANRRFAATNRQIQAMRGSFAGLRRDVNLTRVAIAGATGVLAGGAFLRASDDVIRLRNRLQLVSDDVSEFSSQWDRLRQIAVDTRQPFGQIADAFAKIKLRVDATRSSQEELFQITQGLANAFTIEGVAIQDATNLLRQFGQAVNDPRVRLQDLNPILDSSSLFARELAKTAGVAQAELLALAKGTGVTGDQIKETAVRLASFSNIIDDFQVTSQQGFRVLTEEVSLTIGQITQATGFANSFGSALIKVSLRLRNLAETDMPKIVQALTIFGTLIATAILAPIVRLAVGLGVLTVQFFRLAVVITANTIGALVQFATILTRGVAIALTTTISLLGRALVLLLGLSAPVLVTVAAVAALATGFVVFKDEVLAAINALRTSWGDVTEFLETKFNAFTISARIMLREMVLGIAQELETFINRIISFLNQIEPLIEKFTSFEFDPFGDVDITSGLKADLTTLRAQLVGLQGDALEASNRIATAFAAALTDARAGPALSEQLKSQINDFLASPTVQELKRLFSLEGVGQELAGRFDAFIAENPNLKRFIDAITGNLELPGFEAPKALGGRDQGGGAGSDANFDDLVDETAGAFTQLNSVIRNDTLGAFTDFLNTFNTLKQAFNSFFQGQDGEGGIVSGIIGLFGGQQGGVIKGFQRGTLSIPGYQSGTRKVGGIGFGDSRIVAVEPGEIIVPNRDSDRERLFGNRGTVQFNITGDVSRETRRQLEEMAFSGRLGDLLNAKNVQDGGSPVFGT